MIAHLVAFAWKPGTSAADIDAIDAAIATLPGLVPGLIHYAHGRDLVMRDGNADYAVMAVLDSDDPADYLDHPAHVRVAAEVVSRHVAARHSVQFELAADHPLATGHGTLAGASPARPADSTGGAT